MAPISPVPSNGPTTTSERGRPASDFATPFETVA
jgi:hypothetical protein